MSRLAKQPIEIPKQTEITVSGDVIAVKGPKGTLSRELPGVITVRLSGNGVLVGARADTQYFWLPDQSRQVWEERGGAGGPLGLPMTNIYLAPDGLRQDFEGGYFEVPPIDRPAEQTRAEEIEVVLVDDREAPLRELGPIEGRILRPVTGTAWLVEGGRRRWIPDGPTWECVGGDAAVATQDAPGWAVATLPLGEPASCA